MVTEEKKIFCYCVYCGRSLQQKPSLRADTPKGMSLIKALTEVAVEQSNSVSRKRWPKPNSEGMQDETTEQLTKQLTKDTFLKSQWNPRTEERWQMAHLPL